MAVLTTDKTPSPQDHVEPVAWLRPGEYVPIQNCPFGAMWISDKDDPRAFPVYAKPPQVVNQEPIGFISRQTFAELVHDNSGQFDITTPHDLMSDDLVPIFTLPGAHPSDVPPAPKRVVEVARGEPTDDMLNEGQERLCQISSRTNFDDYEQSEIYKAMRAVDPEFIGQNDLRLALQLAKDMFVASGLDLPHTMEVIDRALSDAVPRQMAELDEINSLLDDGQGDDDGPQIMPDFAPGASVYAKVEACLQLLERRRDALTPSAAQNVGPDDGWKIVPQEAERWLLADATNGNQVLAYEKGRYYNAWLEFEQSEGGWLWMDDADSEPNPSHYRLLPNEPTTPVDTSEGSI